MLHIDRGMLFQRKRAFEALRYSAQLVRMLSIASFRRFQMSTNEPFSLFLSWCHVSSSFADPIPKMKVRSPRVIALEALDKAVASAELALEKVKSSSSSRSSKKGASSSSLGSTTSSSGYDDNGLFGVGAEVELGEGFAGAGDAASGPLKPGDTGEVWGVVCKTKDAVN